MEPLPFNRQGIPQTLSNSQGAQISPPSSVGTSMSYQNYANMLPQNQLPGSLGAANVNDGRMMNSLPHSLLHAGSASFSEYNTDMAVDQRVALSSMMLSGGYNNGMQGPQSFSAIHGESAHQLPVEGDFAYALQRPGVFPAMDLSLSGSSNMPPPQVIGAAFSPRQMPSNHQRSRSFTHSGGGGGSYPQGRRLSHNETMPSSGNQGLSQFMINQGLNSATSIKEDSTDFVLGSGGGSLEASYPTRSSAGSSVTSSLLAQQLEGRSAGANADSYQERMHASDCHIVSSSQPPAYLGAVPVAATGPAYAPAMPYAPNNGLPVSADSAGYYYTTYVTPNGAVMSAPVNLDMQSAAAAMQVHAYGSPYGHYSDQQMPAAYVYPPANLSQPQFEEMKQNTPNQRPHAPPPPRYNHPDMSM